MVAERERIHAPSARIVRPMRAAEIAEIAVFRDDDAAAVASKRRARRSLSA
jgi:hypothetical protein